MLTLALTLALVLTAASVVLVVWGMFRLNVASERDDLVGQTLRFVGGGMVGGNEFQLKDVPRALAWAAAAALLALVIVALGWAWLGPGVLLVPVAVLLVPRVARFCRACLEDEHDATPAEAAAERINAAPFRFLALLEQGLATASVDPKTRELVYTPREGVNVVAVAAGERCVVVELDVYAYKPRSAYPALLEAVIASPFLQAETAELLPAPPHQFRALVDLLPLPEGEEGPHILDEVPRCKPGELHLGVRAGGRPLTLELRAKPNGIAVGPSRGGKSVQLNQMGAELLLTTREDGTFDFDPVIVASTKNRADFAALEGAATVYGSADQITFTEAVLEAVHEGERLAAELERDGVAKLSDIPLHERPRKRAFILDECRDWLMVPGGHRGPREETLEYALADAIAWLYAKSGFLEWYTCLAHQTPVFETFGHRGREIVNSSGWRLGFGHLHTSQRSLLMEGTEGEAEGGAAFAIQGRGNIWTDGGAGGLVEFQGYAVAGGQFPDEVPFSERVVANIRRDLLRAGRLRP